MKVLWDIEERTRPKTIFFVLINFILRKIKINSPLIANYFNCESQATWSLL